MTTLQHLPSAARGRGLLGWVGAAVTAPYLLLKLLWLGGSTVGMVDPAALAGSAYRIANVLTVLADVVAVGTVLALTRPWGRRLPASVLLVPAWVGTGLLGTVLVLAPLAAPFARSAVQSGNALRPWVYALVYASLGAQGVVLLLAFALYVRDRWWLQLRRAFAQPAAGSRAALTLTVLCVAGSLVHLGWAVGVQTGLQGIADRQSAVDRVTLGVYGGVALAVAVGLQLLVRFRGRAPWWAGPLLLWCGTASLVTWGGYDLALAAWDASLSTPALTAAAAARTLCGLAAALLAVRAAGVPGAAGAPGPGVRPA